MKKIFFTMCLAVIACNAQTLATIDDHFVPNPAGTYFQDINGEMDKFVGTWTATQGNTSFTIEIQKLTHTLRNGFYEDVLVGEYSYEVNGVTVIDTRDRLLDQSITPIHHYLFSFVAIPNHRPPKCLTCGTNRRFEFNFVDPARSYLSSLSMYVHHIASNPEQLQVTLLDAGGGILPYDDAPEQPRVPLGDYVFIKQN